MTLDEKQFVLSVNALGLDDKPDTGAHLLRAYTESGRHHHDARHVAKCLSWLDRMRHLAERPDEIALAIWFHDAVYDPKRSDNEEKSADWAREFLHSASAPADVTHRIVEMILATKTHDVSDGDGALIMDIDLSILGTDGKSFDVFEQDVLREYEWLSEEKYREGRAAVLQEFLNRSPIFQVREMRDLLESQAKENLARRIKELQSGKPTS